jgi:hypothetical protein
MSRKARGGTASRGLSQLVEAQQIDARRCPLLRVGRARLDYITVLEPLFTVSAGDHKSAIFGASPNIRLGGKGAAELGVILKQRVCHVFLHLIGGKLSCREAVPSKTPFPQKCPVPGYRKGLPPVTEIVAPDT